MKKRVYRDKYYNKEIPEKIIVTKTETGVKVEPIKKTTNKKKSDK